MANRPSRVAISIPKISPTSARYEGRYPQGDRPGAFSLLSTGLPIFSSAGTAANATSADYNSQLVIPSGAGTVWMDISSLSSAQKVFVAMYLIAESGVDTTSLYYDVARATGGGGSRIHQPATYALKMSTQAGGAGAAPTTGISTIASITNAYASRKHSFSLVGANYFGIDIATSTDSSLQFKFELCDVSGGARDMYIMGDSRTWFGANHANPHGGSVACDALGNLMQPTTGFYVPTLGMGMSGATIGQIDALIAQWLTDNGPPKIMILNAGINDCLASGFTTAFTTAYQSAVNRGIAAGAKVYCETIGDTTASPPHTNLPAFNTAIAGVVAGTPGAFAGFDEFTFSVNNPTFLSGDGVHDNDTGFAALRNARAAFYAPVI